MWVVTALSAHNRVVMRECFRTHLQVELRLLERLKDCDMEGATEAEERIAFMTEATENMQAHFRDEVSVRASMLVQDFRCHASCLFYVALGCSVTSQAHSN
jgi:hypothetical protein